jgi:hypothetical protein
MALVFDIETVADLTAANRDAVTALAGGRDMTPDHYGALCPPLARVACIAWYDTAKSQLGALFDAQLLGATAPVGVDVDYGDSKCFPCPLQACADEAALLSAFGSRIESAASQPDGQLVTFNGRGFDLAVLLHRSVRHGIGSGRAILLKALNENRYRPLLHLDLMDVLTFFGATARWPLAAYALGYGLPSPKSEMDGSQVGPAVAAGRILDVVRYCARDVLATAEIYRTVRSVEGWLSRGQST